uniref:Uncharacterized protein n=1 Tax=Arundo donax TaxID=35708 RepID=A0A0A9H6C5_ARUDO
MHPGTNDGILCSQSALDKWEHYGQGMEDKYGPNWQAGQLKLDASVIYDNAGRKPHGRLRIGDEAISPEKKEAIMSRKRNVHPPTFSCSRMVRLQRENEHLRGENTCLRGLERVVQALAAKGGEDFDALHMVVFDVMNGSYLAPGYFEDVGMEPK